MTANLALVPDGQALRTEALHYDRLAQQFRREARGFQAVADRAADFLTPNSDRLERTRVQCMQRGYAQMAEDMLDLAAEAEVYALDARRTLGAI